MKKAFCILLFFIITAKNGFSQQGSDTSLSKKTYTRWVRAKDIIWNNPDIEATFPEGEKKWFEFISENLNRDEPIKNKAPNGTYTVIIKFNISSHGKLVYFFPETNNGYGMEDEVIRVFKMSPKWIAAQINGSNVNSVKRQAVMFVVEQ